VYPGSTAAGIALVRYNRKSLVNAGALVRQGHRNVIMGAAYHAWLAGHADCVEDFHLSVNEAHRDQPGAAA